MAFEPMVALWDGEKLFQSPLSSALELVEQGKAQRADDYYTGRGLLPRSQLSGYNTRMMAAAVPAAPVEPEHHVEQPVARKRGRPRKEIHDTAEEAIEKAPGDESDIEG